MTDAIAFEVRRCDHIIESDGTVSVMIKIDPCDCRAFLAVSPDQGGRLFITPAPAITVQDEDPLSLTVNYREHALKLTESDFFSRSETWAAAGSDDDYRDWLRDQKCWLQQLPGHVCSGDVVAAHVRRVSRGAGVAIKPDFSALPLCDGAHTDQHNHGESAIGGKERVGRASMLYVRRWSAVAILAALNYENWCHVPPAKLREWASDHSVAHLLPPKYRRASQ